MRRQFRLCPWRLAASLALLPLVAAATDQMPQPAPDPTLPGLEALVDKTVMPPIERGEMAGAVVTVVKDGRVVLLKGYGHADVAKHLPVDPEKTLFRIGSITKTFTWTALMQLIEQGRIGLDQPIAQLLPPELHPAPGRYDAEPITVRHLFTHTGGFEDKVLDHFFLRDPQQVRPLREELTQYKPRRIRPPGASATYSNYGAALAGAIVETVSGEPYADYIDRHILAPLGMTHTTAREPLGTHDSQSMPDALTGDVAQGYISVDGKLEARPFEYMSQIGPAGSISSIGADMGKYLLAHLSPGLILRPQSATTMQSRLFGNAPQLPGIGYGWALDRVGSVRTVWHNGGTMAFHSMLVLVPQEQLGIFISTNASGGAEVAGELPKAILAAYFPAARDKLTPINLEAAALQAYRGAYRGDRLSSSGAERFFVGLIAEMRQVSDSPRGLAINGSQLTAVEPDVFASESGNLLIFQRDAAGRVTGFTTGIESFQRLAPWQTPLALAIAAGLTVLLSLVNLVSGRGVFRPDANRGRRLALALNLGASTGWLAFIGCVVGALALMMRSPLDVVFTYPPTVLVIGLWAGVLAAVLSLGAMASALAATVALTRGRRIQYAVSALLWIGLMLALHEWGLLGWSA